MRHTSSLKSAIGWSQRSTGGAIKGPTLLFGNAAGLLLLGVDTGPFWSAVASISAETCCPRDKSPPHNSSSTRSISMSTSSNMSSTNLKRHVHLLLSLEVSLPLPISHPRLDFGLEAEA